MEETCITISRPSETLLEEMVRAEAKMRLSKEYIRRCDEAVDVPDGWLEVTNQMQRELVQSFAQKHDFNNVISIELALDDMRTAHHQYPNNAVFRKVPVYVRENKANSGYLREGDQMVDTKIFDIDGNAMRLSDLDRKSGV